MLFRSSSAIQNKIFFRIQTVVENPNLLIIAFGNKKGASLKKWTPFFNNVRQRSTLPQGPPCSTIDDERLSFRVRNGTGRFPLSMAAETLSSFDIDM